MMNLYMPSGEYQALMKEMGYTKGSGGGNNNATRQSTANSNNNNDDVMLAQVIFRLDEKWERFAANVAVQWLDLGRQVVQAFRVVAYGVTACCVLYGTACLVTALRGNNVATTTRTLPKNNKKQ